MACAGKRCSAFAFWLCFSPLPIHPIRLQNKENHFGIWSPMTGLDVVHVSFRCRFGCRSNHVGFPRDKFTVKMQTSENGSWTTFFSAILFCLLPSQKKGDLGNPCGAESAYTSTLPTPLPPLPEPFEGSFRFQNFIDMIWMSFRCRSGCRSPPTIPPKHLKPRIRCGDAANYEPRITQDIAKYRVFLAAHYWSTPLKNMEVKWGY